MLEQIRHRLNPKLIEALRLRPLLETCPVCIGRLTEPRLLTLAALKLLRRGGAWHDLKSCRACRIVWTLQIVTDPAHSALRPAVWLSAYRNGPTAQIVTEMTQGLGRLEPPLDVCACCGLRPDAQVDPYTFRFPGDLGFLTAWQRARIRGPVRPRRRSVDWSALTLYRVPSYF